MPPKNNRLPENLNQNTPRSRNCGRFHADTKAQHTFCCFSARLKSCPDTRPPLFVFVVSHPRHKTKDVPRVGHPKFLNKCSKLASATRRSQVSKLAEVSFPVGRRSRWTTDTSRDSERIFPQAVKSCPDTRPPLVGFVVSHPFAENANGWGTEHHRPNSE